MILSICAHLRRAALCQYTRRLLSTGEATLPKNSPRIDYRDLALDPVQRQAEIALRKAKGNVSKVIELHRRYLSELRSVESLRKLRNEASKSRRKHEGKLLKVDLAAAEHRLREALALLESEALLLPNRTHPAVPLGGEENAEVIGTSRLQKPDFSFKPIDHEALADRLGMLDFNAGRMIAGSKFVVLKNDAALLELALAQWTMRTLQDRHGFVPVVAPDIARRELLEGCGFQPRGAHTQVYNVTNAGASPLCLLGTSEVALAGLLAGKVVLESELPLRFAAFGHCFRTEAGSLGATNRGLYRLHQFSKVEMFVFCTPDQSEVEHATLRSVKEGLLDDLRLNWRTLEMPSEELGASAHRKFDIEAWMPGRKTYGEVASISNCTDYQSRRLNIRYRPLLRQRGVPLPFVHTLNGTGCAIPRILLSLLEQHQQVGGSVEIPEVLRMYIGKEKIDP